MQSTKEICIKRLWYLLTGCLSIIFPAALPHLAAAEDMLQNLLEKPMVGICVFEYPDRYIVSIQDQTGGMSGSLFQNLYPVAPVKLQKEYDASHNIFLVKIKKSGEHFLIDTGFGNGRSQLLKRLEAAGITPEMIDAVFITHIHPDHVGGLTLPGGTDAAFPKAKLCITRTEYEAWQKDRGRAGLGKHLAPYQNRLVLLPYNKTIRNFDLTPEFLPGHTPGHTVFRMKVSGDGKTVTFVGDIVHAADLQIPYPGYCARYDMDRQKAVASRNQLLLRGGTWLGAHIPFPGRIEIMRKIKSSCKDQFSYQPAP